MEAAIGITAVSGLAGIAIWLAISRGSALRERDRSQWQRDGLRDELAIASAKLRAQSATILKLEKFAVESGGDARRLVALVAEHRRLLSDADRRHDGDLVHTATPSAGDARDRGGVPDGGSGRSRVLERGGGEASGGVHHSRRLVDVRSSGLPGDPVE